MVLKLWRSSGDIVSALAMTGIRFTRVPSFFMISTSSGFNLPSYETQKKLIFDDKPLTWYQSV